MKLIKTILILIVLITAYNYIFPDEATESPVNEHPEQTQDNQRPAGLQSIALANVLITVEFDNSDPMIGSGVIINKIGNSYLVITNNHVVANATSIIISNTLGNRYQATLVPGSNNHNLDLALLEFESLHNYPVATLASSDAAVGDSIITTGFPGHIFSVTFGTITGYTNYPHIGHQVISHSAFTAGGSSGSAVFNLDLKIVGINFSVITSNGQFIRSLAIPINIINQYLEAVNSF